MTNSLSRKGLRNDEQVYHFVVLTVPQNEDEETFSIPHSTRQQLRRCYSP